MINKLKQNDYFLVIYNQLQILLKKLALQYFIFYLIKFNKLTIINYKWNIKKWIKNILEKLKYKFDIFEKKLLKFEA